MRAQIMWKLPAKDRVRVPRELYAMDIREVARRLNISRGLAFVLEKSALTKLRNNGQAKELLELVRLKNSLRVDPVFPDLGGARMNWLLAYCLLLIAYRVLFLTSNERRQCAGVLFQEGVFVPAARLTAPPALSRAFQQSDGLAEAYHSRAALFAVASLRVARKLQVLITRLIPWKVGQVVGEARGIAGNSVKGGRGPTTRATVGQHCVRLSSCDVAHTGEAMPLNRCPFPECTLDLEHDGDHRFKRPPFPKGELRHIWTFARNWTLSGTVRCDVNWRHAFAEAFYADEFGFGWSLCARCENRAGIFTPAPRKPSSWNQAGAA